MSLDAPVLKARKPTAAVPWPLILVEGEEKAGKSWVAALLTKSTKVGACYWLDLGEGAADEYAAIPGTKYEVLEHDGTYAAVLEQVLAVRELAKLAAAAGEPPLVLVVDSASDVWNGLKDWVSLRARHSAKNKAKLADDPAAELDVSRNLWNDAATRYRRLMTAPLTFPGIVVTTARGKEVSGTDPATGQPYRDGRRDYSVESHKSLPYDATLWLRMSRTRPPVVVGARSVFAGIKPGSDEPQPITNEPDNLLEWLVFDVLKCNPSAAHVRDLKGLTGGDLLDSEREDEQARQQAERPQQARQQAAPAAPEPSPAEQAQAIVDRMPAGVTLGQLSHVLADAERRELAELNVETPNGRVTLRT